jgi:hypothetical protein
MPFQHAFAGCYGPPWPDGLYKRFNSSLFDDSDDISDYEYDVNTIDFEKGKHTGSCSLIDSKIPRNSGHIDKDAIQESFGGGSIDLDETDDGIEYVVIQQPSKKPTPTVEIFEIASDNDEDSDIEIVSIGPSRINPPNISRDNNNITISSSSAYKPSNAKTTVNSFLMHPHSKPSTSSSSTKQAIGSVKEEWVSISSSTSSFHQNVDRGSFKKVKQSTLDDTFFKS